MKAKLLFLSLIGCLFLTACKKSSDSEPVQVTSEWTFNGVTYKVTGASYDGSTNELFASDDAGASGGGNFIRVFFGAITRPSSSSTLTVSNYGSSTSNPTTCTIQVGNIYGSNPLQYLSTGKAGDKVTLTVANNGKLTTTFSNISVTDGATTKTVSGTIAEQ